jgi:protein PsiE
LRQRLPDERLIIVRWLQGDFMGKQHWAEKWRENMHGLAESLGNLLMEAFHYLALFAIGAVTAWAAVMTFFDMLEKGHISIDDILLLFIYLELAAMVGIYFKTNHMPIRFMIYVAITALTRLMISDISHNHKPDMGVVMVSGAILLLAAAIFVVRYASSRFPSVQVEGPRRKRNVANDAAEKDDTQSDD